MKISFYCLLLLAFNAGATNLDCNVYDELSPIQKGRLEFAYNQGKSHDLGWTSAAIVLTESSAGKWRISLDSKDYGLYQINIKTGASILGVTNHYKKVELAQRLIRDDVLSSYLALDILNYFKDYHKGDWKKMVKSYNTGFNFNSEKANNYLDKVSGNVKMLQHCMKIY